MKRGIGTIAPPAHPRSEFFAYETECRNALKPVLARLLDMAQSAGWNRRTAATALMFLAAHDVSAASQAFDEAAMTEGRSQHDYMAVAPMPENSEIGAC
jgi:hypothetical protein